MTEGRRRAVGLLTTPPGEPYLTLTTARELGNLEHRYSHRQDGKPDNLGEL
jgi:hypothetical protein